MLAQALELYPADSQGWYQVSAPEKVKNVKMSCHEDVTKTKQKH